ncbi:hypothetical protein UZ36_08065 [Candidatus Nitromaritima sp. SCGC AAA799-C22]|nr:hypothetical protein UZ36_08065 [Candidatus Nitromaritima sp. SCGC AAA799-C22]
MNNETPKLFLTIVLTIFFLNLSYPPVFAAADLEEGIVELAQKISKNMTDKQRRKIAIIEFSDLDGNVTSFGQYLAEKLITQLFIDNPGGFEVVERRQLMKVLSEQKLTMTGLLDAQAMEKVGQILGIDAIVTGSITDLGNQVDVNARLIGVDTARVFAVAATKIPKVGTVKSLIEKMATPVQTFAPPSGPGTTGVSKSVARIAPPKVGIPLQDFPEFRVEAEALQVTKDNDVFLFLKYINKL